MCVSVLVLQWESQHAGLSCEQYQSWKRENDPEYQRQGLAGYLRDNGISENTHIHTPHYYFLATVVEGNTDMAKRKSTI